jgi:hypothetical protein
MLPSFRPDLPPITSLRPGCLRPDCLSVSKPSEFPVSPSPSPDEPQPKNGRDGPELQKARPGMLADKVLDVERLGFRERQGARRGVRWPSSRSRGSAPLCRTDRRGSRGSRRLRLCSRRAPPRRARSRPTRARLAGARRSRCAWGRRAAQPPCRAYTNTKCATPGRRASRPTTSSAPRDGGRAAGPRFRRVPAARAGPSRKRPWGGLGTGRTSAAA